MFGTRKLSLSALAATAGSVVLIIAGTSPSATADSPWDGPHPIHVADSPWDGPHPIQVADSPWDRCCLSPVVTGLSA